jgi:hypothetical protein
MLWLPILQPIIRSDLSGDLTAEYPMCSTLLGDTTTTDYPLYLSILQPTFALLSLSLLQLTLRSTLLADITTESLP